MTGGSKRVGITTAVATIERQVRHETEVLEQRLQRMTARRAQLQQSVLEAAVYIMRTHGVDTAEVEQLAQKLADRTRVCGMICMNAQVAGFAAIILPVVLAVIIGVLIGLVVRR